MRALIAIALMLGGLVPAAHAQSAQAICSNTDMHGFQTSKGSFQTLVDQFGGTDHYAVTICGCVGNGQTVLNANGVVPTVNVIAGQCAVAANVSVPLIQVLGIGQPQTSLSGVYKLDRIDGNQ